MKNFDYSAELKKIIEGKQLVEVHLQGAPSFKVAYLLAANNDYLTFAEVSSSATFAGVIMCWMEDVDAIKVETIYLSELSKQIPDGSIHAKARELIKGMKSGTFDEFFASLEKSQTIAEITYENEDTLAGRVMGQTDSILVLDEYYAENDRRFARSYINKDIILRVAVDLTWLRTITNSLVDKKL